MQNSTGLPPENQPRWSSIVELVIEFDDTTALQNLAVEMGRMLDATGSRYAGQPALSNRGHVTWDAAVLVDMRLAKLADDVVTSIVPDRMPEFSRLWDSQWKPQISALTLHNGEHPELRTVASWCAVHDHLFGLYESVAEAAECLEGYR